jgi:hypothetical protein
LTGYEFDPLQKTGGLGWDLSEQGVQALETCGFDQTFLVAHPLAAFAHKGVGLLHNGRGRLTGCPRHIPAPGVHAGVVEAK